MPPSSTQKTVSVIMPVYNAEQYLGAAIDSILSQTFVDFEFLIVDDGSTDRSADILSTIQDDRVRIITQKNSGVVPSLNLLLRQASGQFIARMDADDISDPRRLEQQVFFLQEHSDIGLVGTWAKTIDRTGHEIGYQRHPVTDQFLKEGLCFDNVFTHGSIMIRRECMRPYDSHDLHAEDYGVWCRVAIATKVANLPQYLYIWRTHQSSISHQHDQVQRSTFHRIRTDYQQKFFSKKSGRSFLYSALIEKHRRGILSTLAGIIRISTLALSKGHFVWAAYRVKATVLTCVQLFRNYGER